MTVILVNRHDAAQVEQEEKVKWALGILSFIGVPVEDWPNEPSMENLRKVRGALKKLEIDIDSNSGLKIYHQNNLLAEWLRPTYILREDSKELDVKYRYYLEMHLNCKSVFDDQLTKEDNKIEWEKITF